MNDRMKTAIEKAGDAFWEKIAEACHEARTGDLGPENVFPFDRSAAAEAVEAWVLWNVPGQGLGDDAAKKKPRKPLAELTVDDVVSAYKGDRGVCCCGCSGMHYYNSRYLAEVSKRCGYQITAEDEEVDDEAIASILARIQDLDGPEMQREYDLFAVDVGPDTLIVYLRGEGQ